MLLYWKRMYNKRAYHKCIWKWLSIRFGLENVALHKPAWQKHPYFNTAFGASLAVDGKKTDLSEFGGECVASSFGSTAEWRVDLKGVLSIHHIAIQYSQTKPVWGKYFLY